jgi:hypothetical protein
MTVVDQLLSKRQQVGIIANTGAHGLGVLEGEKALVYAKLNQPKYSGIHKRGEASVTLVQATPPAKRLGARPQPRPSECWGHAVKK